MAAPHTKLKEILDSGAIGKVFRARLTMVSGFNVYQNEPTLVDLEKFVITDIGTHILDTARFLIREAKTSSARRKRFIQTSRARMSRPYCWPWAQSRLTVTIELGYPETPLKNDAFPQTFALFIEGPNGSVGAGKGLLV